MSLFYTAYVSDSKLLYFFMIEPTPKDFVTYRKYEQPRLRQACLPAQSCQILDCSFTPNKSLCVGPDQTLNLYEPHMRYLCGMCDQQNLRSACAYAQSDQSLCLSCEYSMSVKLLTEHNLEFLSLKGGCTGSSESTLVKIPHCLKSHATAHIVPQDS